LIQVHPSLGQRGADVPPRCVEGVGELLLGEGCPPTNTRPGRDAVGDGSAAMLGGDITGAGDGS
jgi:hypothetical protein